MNNKKNLFFVLRILIAVLLLYLVSNTISFDKFIQVLDKVEFFWIILAVLNIYLLRILMSIRWKIILGYRNFNYSVIELFKTLLISGSFGYLLPGGIGIDIMRGYQLTKVEGKVVQISETIIVDRIIGLYSILLLSLLGSFIAKLFFSFNLFFYLLLIVHALIILFWLLLVIFKKKLLSTKKADSTNFNKVWNKALGYIKILTNLRMSSRLLLKLLTISLLVQIFRCILFYILFLAYNQFINPVLVFIFIPIVLFSTYLPISLGGLGVRENILIFIFNNYNVPTEVSLSVGLSSQVLQILVILPGILLWFFDKGITRKTKVVTEND